MCSRGCNINPETQSCRTCGRSLKEVMDGLQVPEADQQHTIHWLIYHQYQ